MCYTEGQRSELENALSSDGLDIICEQNENGTYTWVSDEKAITEFDPMFICAYGYQDNSDTSGPKHVIWMTLAGFQTTLTRIYNNRIEAMALLGKVRKAKRIH